MKNKYREKAKEIIEKILYITIATVSKDGMPWNSPVFSAFDNHYTFYWGSAKNAQHSQNITENENVFIVIYNSINSFGEGVYLQAKAYKVTDRKEIEKAYALLEKRSDWYPWTLNDFLEDSSIGLYKAIPQKIWVREDSKNNGKFVDVRVEIELFS